MSNKLYVGNLPYDLSEEQLKDIFSAAGYVDSVKIVKDKFDGRSKGFGFVVMQSQQEAQAALDALNGKEVEGRKIKVDISLSKAPNFSRS